MSTSSHSPTLNHHFLRYLRIAILIFLAVGIYSVFSQLKGLHQSWSALEHANRHFIIAAIVASFATYFAAAAVYKSLAVYTLRLTEITIVQFAAMFINRLLPAGSGAVGTNIAYLHHRKHSYAQATAIASINNLLGFMGHIFIVVVTIGFNEKLLVGRATINFRSLGVICLCCIVVTTGLFAMRKKLQRYQFLVHLRHSIQSYGHRPSKLLLGFCASVLLTSANVLCLWFCAKAVGVDIPLPIALFALTAGVAGGAIVPTPGGLGGFEAGMYAYFLTYHIAAPSAVAAVLIFRGISFWLPLVIGAVALLYCRKQQLLDTKA